MKIGVIIPVLNQFDISRETINHLKNDEYEIYVVDNGSSEEYIDSSVNVIRYDEPIGSYPVFNESLTFTDEDILAFFHSDFFVYDKNWHKKVIAEFERDDRLGMIGFIGSNEIDNLGGRGLGTVSNFQGKETLREISSIGNNNVFEVGIWKGSHSSDHGKTSNGFSYASVVDGCSMIIRRKALEELPFRSDYFIHHFYDRLISCQLLEHNWKIGVLGIECDHISGQTCNVEPSYFAAAKKWLMDRNATPEYIGVNWDHEGYIYNEKMFLNEYRDKKHFIPMKVDNSGNIIRW